MYCYVCGNKIEENLSNCPNCNTYIENITQQYVKYRSAYNWSRVLEILGYLTLGLVVILPFIIYAIYPLNDVEFITFIIAIVIWIGILASVKIIQKAHTTIPVFDIEQNTSSQVEASNQIIYGINNLPSDMKDILTNLMEAINHQRALLEAFNQLPEELKDTMKTIIENTVKSIKDKEDKKENAS